MELAELLVVGRRVEVEVLEVPELAGRYFSQIALVENQKRLYITLPVDHGQRVPLKLGHALRLRVLADGVLHLFASKVTGLGNELSCFIVDYPAVDAVRRPQKRDYLRTEVRGELDFQVRENHYRGALVDVGGGGLQFESTVDLEVGQRLKLNFALPNGLKCDGVVGQVRRREQRGGGALARRRYGVAFLQLPESLRNKIVAYIFESDISRKKPETAG